MCTSGPKLLVCTQEAGMLLLAEYCLLNLAAEQANQSKDYLITWHVDYHFLVINKAEKLRCDLEHKHTASLVAQPLQLRPVPTEHKGLVILAVA